MLTRQQPTHWAASQGRAVNPLDNNPGGQPGSGLDPGLVPPVPPGFTGFLICVETLVDGTPASMNSLIGVATVGQVNDDPAATNNVSKYNAVAIPACVCPRAAPAATPAATTTATTSSSSTTSSTRAVQVACT